MTKKITDNQAFTGQLLYYNYYPDKKYLPSSAFKFPGKYHVNN